MYWVASVVAEMRIGAAVSVVRQVKDSEQATPTIFEIKPAPARISSSVSRPRILGGVVHSTRPD
jgi:hypothetical protein